MHQVEHSVLFTKMTFCFNVCVHIKEIITFIKSKTKVINSGSLQLDMHKLGQQKHKTIFIIY